MKLSDYVIKRVAREVDHIFLLPGGGCMHLLDSVGRCQELEFICNLHEQAAAIAADAYGQYTNHLGVALVTTGPGGTNTLTGVAGAWLESTPCLFISGQVKRADLRDGRGVRQMGFQEINIVDIVQPITKYAVTVKDPLTIRFHLEKALRLARHGRPGPVWIDIPLDVQAAEINENDLPAFVPEEDPAPPDRDTLPRQVAETIRLLNQSQRPVILAGNGIRLAGALDDFLKLIHSLQVPVLTTWKALDFLAEDDPLYIGRPGAVGHRGANFAQQNSDCLLALGARLDLGQTAYNHPNFARAARKIMVDIDPAEIAKMDMPLDVAVCGDAAAFIREFLRQLGDVKPRDRSAWRRRCADWKARYPVLLPEYWNLRNGVSNYALIETLSDLMTSDDLFVPGSSGACSEISMQAFRVKKGMRVLNDNGLGAMGFGLPSAIGACIAAGRRRTVSMDGDGGFPMNSHELEVVRRLDLPIKCFVLDNGGYVSIQSTQRAYFDGRFVASEPGSGLTLPSALNLAHAYGLHAVTIENHARLRERVQQILERPGPVVCQVKISPDHFTAPRVSSGQRPDGSMYSKPMEDLWPFLDREEFRRNMIVPPLEEG